MLKQITQAIVGVLGIYLLIQALSNLAKSTFGIAYQADLTTYIYYFGPTIALFVSGILCLKYRVGISKWLNKDETAEITTEIDIDKLERIAYVIIGLLTLISSISFFTISFINYFIKPLIKISGTSENAIRSYAFVQFIAAMIECALALILILIPQKVQTLLNKTRSL